MTHSKQKPSSELDEFAAMNNLTVQELLALSISEIEQLSGLTAHLLVEIIQLQQA
ncbi:MAG TPA: hypothetical protein PLI97_06715 [Fluviicola sp.]|nr:hypothetical protein [Fluviicola sp.]